MLKLIKTDDQIKKARIAGQVVGKILKELATMIVVGNNGLMLAKRAKEMMKSNDCQPSFLNYHGFPSVICVSINDQLIHGIPNQQKFQEGDLVSIDVGCQYQGIHADAALTKIVGRGSKSDQTLLATTFNSLELVIKQLKAGHQVGDIGHWINNYVSQKGYYLTTEYAGHGIGTKLHEIPIIPNVGRSNSGLVLEPKMMICVEPMVLTGGVATTVLKDGWTVVAKNGKNNCHFEHTLLITAQGVEVLTQY